MTAQEKKKEQEAEDEGRIYLERRFLTAHAKIPNQLLSFRSDLSVFPLNVNITFLLAEDGRAILPAPLHSPLTQDS
jgi:hypothetical protein